jgi:KDO2-lipid IV(A) lauroyltransferase
MRSAMAAAGARAPMKYRPKHIAEYVLLRGVTGAFLVLPHRVALLIAWLLALVTFHLIRFRRAEAERRIRSVFGDRFDRRQVRRIAWISLRNFFFNTAELARLPRVTPAWIRRVAKLEGLETLQAVMAEGKGVILAVPHMGNWDLAAVGVRMLGPPVFIITADQRNPLVNAYMHGVRRDTGMEVMVRGTHVLRHAVQRIRKGGFLAILPDLRSKTPALDIEFLGGRANLPEGMALFAHMAGAPVYPAVMSRVGWTRHHWRLREPVMPNPSADRAADLKRVTQEVVSVLDRAIREEPEQFFWYNKRWVLDPL